MLGSRHPSTGQEPGRCAQNLNVLSPSHEQAAAVRRTQALFFALTQTSHTQEARRLRLRTEQRCHHPEQDAGGGLTLCQFSISAKLSPHTLHLPALPQAGGRTLVPARTCSELHAADTSAAKCAPLTADTPTPPCPTVPPSCSSLAGHHSPARCQPPSCRAARLSTPSQGMELVRPARLHIYKGPRAPAGCPCVTR